MTDKSKTNQPSGKSNSGKVLGSVDGASRMKPVISGGTKGGSKSDKGKK